MENKRRPFWLPASNYYILAIAVSTAAFFLMWGILHDGGEETPWITAGVAASVLLCVAVVMREVILRRARDRFMRQQRTMENRVRSAGLRAQINDQRPLPKLTIEQNASILREIGQKSDAAKLLSKFSSTHREVFEMCGEYISLNEVELRSVAANSPRLAPLLKGRSTVTEYHRYHLLKWAEIESRTFSAEAQSRSRTEDKVEAAQKALTVIDSALRSYPQEQDLLESREVLLEMIVSINVSGWIERAEKASRKGNTAKAKNLYRDALFYLGRDDLDSSWRDEVAIRIDKAIGDIDLMENKASDLSK